MAKVSTKTRGGSTLKKLRANLKDAGLLTRPSKKGDKKKINTAESRLEKLKKVNDRVNPFELKFNREKHDVLNRKRKGTEGKPAESRLRGHENRKKTILTEFKYKNRVGAFRDKRFGETDPNMTPEERMLERFALEKRSRAEKSAVYNLDDHEEELTHFGQALSNLENIDEHDPRLDDDDTKDRDYTRDLHFGGPENANDNRKRSYKEIMQEVITKSKFHKVDRQKLKEETEMLRQDLNDDFDSIRELLMDTKQKESVPVSKKADKDAEISKSFDDYDVFVRQLIHEKRARPTDRLKTEDEIAKEEADKLIQLEKKRKRGMKGPDESGADRQISGDALGDLGFYQGSSGEDDGDSNSDDDSASDEGEQEALVYKDGKLVNPGKIFMKPKSSKDEASESDEEVSGTEEISDDEGVQSDEEQESDSVAEEEILESELPFSASESENVNDLESSAEEESDSANEVEETTTEIPFVIPMPKDMEEFKRLVSKYDAENQKVVLDRLLVLHHPSLSSENPEKLKNLLRLSIDFLCGVADTETGLLTGRISLMYPLIVKLAFQYPESVSAHIKKRLSQLHDRLKHRIAKRSSKLVEVRDVVLFLLITRLFATSDYRHDIVLSMYLIIGEVFCQASYLLNAFMDSRNPPSGIKEQICAGLLFSHIYMECQTVSKRYMPEMMYFLGKSVKFLEKNTDKDFADTEEDDAFEFSYIVSCEHVAFGKLLMVACKTVEVFADLYRDKEVLHSDKGSAAASMAGVFLNPATHEGWSWEAIFSPYLGIDSELAAVKQMKSHLKAVHTEIMADRRKRCQRLGVKYARPPLQWQKKVVKNIKTAEPKFESNYNMDRKAKSASSERDEQKKLEYMYKKEMKGAIRELKRDTQFMATEKLKETRAKDQAYKKMINQIQGSIGNEAGDAKAEHKVKKRKTKK